MTSVIYSGTVGHERLSPTRHRFEYPLLLLGVWLDELPALQKTIRGFGYNSRNICSMRDRDYLRPDGRSLAESVPDFLSGYQGERILLVSFPRYLGRLFNPVSFYFSERSSGMEPVLAEVNNTFRDRHVYRLSCTRHDDGSFATRQEKRFHVSPFNNLNGSYSFRFSENPLDRLNVGVDLHQEGQMVFRSWITASARPLNSASLAKTLCRHPLSAAVTMPRILRQAATLRLIKRLNVHHRPEPVHPDTLLHRGKVPSIVTFLNQPDTVDDAP